MKEEEGSLLSKLNINQIECMHSMKSGHKTCIDGRGQRGQRLFVRPNELTELIKLIFDGRAREGGYR